MSAQVRKKRANLFVTIAVGNRQYEIAREM
jgi:hypothetical protein